MKSGKFFFDDQSFFWSFSGLLSEFFGGSGVIFWQK
jgi:hypothetical protein